MLTSTPKRGLYGTLIVSISLLAILAVLFAEQPSAAKIAAAATPRHSLHNYDIRLDDSAVATDFLATTRTRTGRTPAKIAELREEISQGETALRSKIPHLTVEYNDDLRVAEVIGSSVWGMSPGFLTLHSSRSRHEILRQFIKENSGLTGVDDAQAGRLVKTADYTNPDGGLSFTHLEQGINNIPVFRGEIKAAFTSDGRIVRVINNLAPSLENGSLSGDFHDPLDAVKAASRHIGQDTTSEYPVKNTKDSTTNKAVFGSGDWATTAEKMYFPTEPGVAVPSWRVLIWLPENAYYVIVDAATGTMFARTLLRNRRFRLHTALTAI